VLEGQLAERMAGQSDLAAMFHRIQTDIVKCSTNSELVAVVRQAYENLGVVCLDSTSEFVFPDRSVHLIVATDLLIRRVRLPAIMFRFDQDPDAMRTISNIGDEGGYFASSAEWFKEIIGVNHYLGPLLGCLSPRFWCMAAGRPPFSILFNLGRDIAGQRHAPMEPMQLLPGLSRQEPVPDDVQLTATSCQLAVP
jgi:hypothetical protein